MIMKTKTVDTVMNNKLTGRVTIEYNEQGLETSRLYLNGFKIERKYNEQGLEIHYRNSKGLERTRYYNENGLEVRCENNDGTSYIKEYNEKGLEVSYKHSSGAYEYKKYDEQGRIILREDHLGNQYEYTYKTIIPTINNSRSIRSLNKTGLELIIHECKMINKNSGYIQTSEYDNNHTLRRLNKNNDIEYVYDEQGRIIEEIRKGICIRFWRYSNDKIECYRKEQGVNPILEIVTYIDENGKESKLIYGDKVSECKYNDNGNLIYIKVTDKEGNIGIVTCDIEYYE